MHAGDRCPNCRTGEIKVLNTRVSESEQLRFRWLGCGSCGFRPPNNKQIVPLRFAPRRRAMRRRMNMQRRN